MQAYELTVRGRSIRPESADTTLVRTSRGVDEARFRFYSAEWLEFGLSAAFYTDEALEEVRLDLAETPGEEWLAEATCGIPSTVLETLGSMGVTVHGFDAAGNHIITERAAPLSVEREGDGIGDGPGPNPS